MMSSMPPFDEGLPWEEEVLDVPDLPDCIAPASGEYGDPQENSIDILNAIYHELILPCVRLIEEGQNEQAYKMYRDHVLMLENQYILA